MRLGGCWDHAPEERKIFGQFFMVFMLSVVLLIDEKVSETRQFPLLVFLITYWWLPLLLQWNEKKYETIFDLTVKDGFHVFLSTFSYAISILSGLLSQQSFIFHHKLMAAEWKLHVYDYLISHFRQMRFGRCSHVHVSAKNGWWRQQKKARRQWNNP